MLPGRPLTLQRQDAWSRAATFSSSSNKGGGLIVPPNAPESSDCSLSLALLGQGLRRPTSPSLNPPPPTVVQNCPSLTRTNAEGPPGPPTPAPSRLSCRVQLPEFNFLKHKSNHVVPFPKNPRRFSLTSEEALTSFLLQRQGLCPPRVVRASLRPVRSGPSAGPAGPAWTLVLGACCALCFTPTGSRLSIRLARAPAPPAA